MLVMVFVGVLASVRATEYQGSERLGRARSGTAKAVNFEIAGLDGKPVVDKHSRIVAWRVLPAMPGAGKKAGAGAEKAVEPNAVKAKAKRLEGMEKALADINRQGQREMRQWTQAGIEDGAGLAEAVQMQVAAELNFIRQIALEEGAVKTTAAIDGILASRQQRFERLIKAIQARQEKARLSEREQRMEKRQGRTRRSSRDRSQRRRSREDKQRERENYDRRQNSRSAD